jgi:hypothetical protein
LHYTLQVQGKSTGLPVIAAVNVGALTNASATAAQAARAALAAQDAMARERVAQRQNARACSNWLAAVIMSIRVSLRG